MKNKTVLIVEDDAIARMTLQKMLQGEGYETAAWMSTGAEAIAWLEQNHCDLVFLDFNLEGDLNGWDTGKEMKRIRYVPIVYCSASSPSPSILSENLPFFPKPYNKKHLQQLLSEIEAKQRITQHALYNLEHRLLLDLVYDINGIAMTVTDAQGRYVRVNKTFLELMGYEEAEIIGQPFTLIVPPDFSAMAQQIYEQSFQGKLKELPMEWQVYRKDGQMISIWVTSSTVDLQSQDRLKMTTFLLKTEMAIQQYQHEKSFIEQLFERLNQHYYLLSSLLFGHTQQILQSEQTYRIFLEGLFKLRSIALAQEQHQNGLEINLSHYLQALCNQLYPIMQQQQNLHLHTDFEPSVWGHFKEVLPLGLMLSELLFNACQHAFSSPTSDGQIQVRLYQEGQLRCLSIEDNGQGLPPGFSIQSNNTPGMQLLTNLSQQLQAQLQILPHQGCKILICW